MQLEEYRSGLTSKRAQIVITKEETQEVIAGPNYTLVGTSYTANEIRKRFKNRKWSKESLFACFSGLACFGGSIARLFYPAVLNFVRIPILGISFFCLCIGLHCLTYLRSNGPVKGVTTATLGVFLCVIAMLLLIF